MYMYYNLQRNNDLKLILFLIIFTIIWLNFVGLILREPIPLNILFTTNPIPKVENFTVNDIKRKIALINKEQKIYNEEIFGPLLNDSLVIVVQVHSRILYLKHLISSLRVAKGISNVLLVFSHDYFNEEINNLIQTIKFCKVMQLFYPYTIQIYPQEFPGSDSNDCASDILANRTLINTNVNDTTCRNPRKLQVKHHWWWKANKIFNLKILKDYQQPVLFLEDDFYLVEDFILVLKLMENVSKIHCRNCKIMSLAVYTEAVQKNDINPEFMHTVLVSNQFNNMMGLAFTRKTWLEIIQCKDSFCTYNEHNWDFSLKNVLTTCMHNVMAMTLNAPRVYHLGTCGMHFTADDCDPTARLLEIYADISQFKTFLYPTCLNIVSIFHSKQNVGGPYGGWSDPRDQALCLRMIKSNDFENISILNISLHS